MGQLSQESARKYEGVIIMHPDTPEADQKALFKRNAEIIKSFGGQVHHLDTWGKRRLANSIEKLNRGIYFHTTFEAQGAAIAELERTMRINDRVLRFSHLRLDDRVSLAKHVEGFKQGLVDALNREKEREAKAQARRAQAAAAREAGGGMGGGPRRRDDGYGRGDDDGDDRGA